MTVKDRDEPLDALDRRLEELRELTNSLQAARDALARHRHEEAHATVLDLAERYHISDEALIAFLENAGELLNGKELSVEDARVPGSWRQREQRGRTSSDRFSRARMCASCSEMSLDSASMSCCARRLIGMSDRSGRRRFPLFQFRDGRPAETLIATYWTVVDGGADEWTAASWCVAADPALDGSSPVQWSAANGDAEQLLRLARQDAARFAQ